MRLKMNEFQKLFLIFRLPLNDLHHLNKYKDDHIVIDIEVEEIQKEFPSYFFNNFCVNNFLFFPFVVSSPKRTTI